MNAPFDCPEIEDWQALFRDSTTSEQWQRYERHLECCPICQHRLESSEQDHDPLVDLGRQLGDPTLTAADPTLTCVLERLRNSADIDTTPEQPELHFLRATEREDLLGMLGEYEVSEVIGQGGMGVVLKAFDPALKRVVAIKVLASSLAGSATARKRFTREAQAAAAVCHDHIVTVHGVSEAEGLPFLVMQFIPGESLQARLDRTGLLQTEAIVQIGLQTALGLAAAHAQGLIHRDIKPANLLLENGLARVKISDFGLARMADDVSLTQNGVVAGTPEYMSPEQARGETVDHRTDLFSLGSVLYSMCVGSSPFRAATALATLRQVSDNQPRPIRSLNPDIPAWLESFIMRLLEKNPTDRFQTAHEVASLLEGYLSHLRQPVTVPVPVLPATPQTASAAKKRRPLWSRPLLWLAAGVVLLSTLGLWRAMQAVDPPVPRQVAEPPAPTPALPAQFYHDFRGAKRPHPAMKWSGITQVEEIIPEEKGLRIKLPAGRGRKDPAGLALTQPVKGDFEITAGYEILDAPRPQTGNGVGFELYLVLETPTVDALGINRVKRVEGAEQYRVTNITTLDGKRRHNTKEFLTTARSGRLRISRKGLEVTYWAAEATEPLKELRRIEQTSADLRMIRVAAYPGQSLEPVEIRLIDLRVRAESMSPELTADPAIAIAAENKPAVARRWLLVVQIVGLAGALTLFGVGTWLYVRRRAAKDTKQPPDQGQPQEQSQPDQTAEQPPEESQPVSISFPCPGCQKNIKARAALAGKKVKCPQCSEMLIVPEKTALRRKSEQE